MTFRAPGINVAGNDFRAYFNPREIVRNSVKHNRVSVYCITVIKSLYFFIQSSILFHSFVHAFHSFVYTFHSFKKIVSDFMHVILALVKSEGKMLHVTRENTHFTDICYNLR